MLARGASQGFFVNQGLLRKTSTGGATNFQLEFTNAGTVEILSGSLEGTSKYVQTAGSTLVPVGRTMAASSLDLNGGVIEIAGSFVGTGSATIDGGTLTGDGTVQVNTFLTFDPGTIAGNLSLTGRLINGGLLTPGNSPGKIDVDGDVDLTTDSSFDAELAGLAAGTGYDQLTATSPVSLGGSLNVLLTPGFLPQVGDSFLLIDAETTNIFDTVSLPIGFQWQLETDPVVLSVVDILPLFADGFEDGTTDAWDAVVPVP